MNKNAINLHLNGDKSTSILVIDSLNNTHQGNNNSSDVVSLEMENRELRHLLNEALRIIQTKDTILKIFCNKWKE